MHHCPVCGQLVDALGGGPTASDEATRGLIVNLSGETHAVHAACLKAFERAAQRQPAST